jgi:hypothetical protein
MAAVDDAADAVLPGGFRLRDHHVHVVGKADRHGPSRLLGERLRQRIADRQMLVKQHRAAKRVGRDVLEESADDRATLGYGPGLHRE